MNYRTLAVPAILLVLGCGSADLSHDELAKEADALVTNRLARYSSELQRLRQGGLPENEPVNIGYSFYAGGKRRAIKLQAAIQTWTPYETSISYIKEPEEGWFVYGRIPAVVSTPASDRQLLTNMVRLGLEHGCEIRWWVPERAKKGSAV